MQQGAAAIVWRGPGTTWDGGKSDHADIAAAERVLVDLGIPSAMIMREWFLHVRAEDEALIVSTGGPHKDESVLWTRHPDLMVVAGDHEDEWRPLLIVEMDGGWHDTKPGRKATDRRDRDYRSASVPFVAVRLSEYPQGGWEPLIERAVRAIGPVLDALSA